MKTCIAKSATPEFKACIAKCDGAGLFEEDDSTEDAEELGEDFTEDTEEDIIEDAEDLLGEDAKDEDVIEGDDEFRSISGGDDSKVCKEKCFLSSGMRPKARKCRKELQPKGAWAKVKPCLKKI